MRVFIKNRCMYLPICCCTTLVNGVLFFVCDFCNNINTSTIILFKVEFIRYVYFYYVQMPL